MINREPIQYRRTSGFRRLAIIVGVIGFVILMTARWVATLWTDYLWYDSLDASGVWKTLTFTKVWLVVGASLIAFIVVWINLWVADRVSPRGFLVAETPDEELLERYHDWMRPRAGRVRLAFASLFGVFIGLGAGAWWQDWLGWRNGTSFGIADPIFSHDVSRYVFALPLYRDVYGWLFQLLLVTTLIIIGAHYLNGGIVVGVRGRYASGGVKAHISILVAMIALLKAGGYVFDKWDLLYSSRGAVFGASYTDVNAQVPALSLLIFISIICAVILLVNVRFKGWSLPIIAFGLWVVTSIGVGGAYPALVQRFSVEPNELNKELPYVQHNLDSTRFAYGLDGVEEKPFTASIDLTAEIVEENRSTVDNIRLWDPGVLAVTYPEVQNIKTYYNFTDVDVDRYVINDELTQVMTATRTLDEEKIPGSGWVNERLVYTHGLGAVLSPANDVTSDGLPDFLIKDIPPVNLSSDASLDIEQPRVYFSDDSERDFLIVGSNEGEVDIPQGAGTSNETSTVHYDGDGGVELGGPISRAAWALRFGDLNTFISGEVDAESRVMIARNIRERVKRVAPFLAADDDPYMVVVNGRLVWIMDLYTVTDRFPYSATADTGRLNAGSDLPGRFNYIRNSVKAVVDAYDGSVDLYVFAPDDPIIRTNEKIFPGLFKPLSEFPAELVDHIRYPEEMFRVQTDMFSLYHMTNPVDLYQLNDPWQIARDPSTSRKPDLRGATGAAMLPYYLLMELPEEERLSFLLMQPFTPRDRPNMSAFVVAKSGPLDEYGDLISYTMPEDRQVNGPGQVGDFIDQDPKVSAEFTLLSQEGSTVVRGNLLVVPIEDSLLYVQPIYLEAELGGIPQFKRVVASFNSQIEIADTLDEVLALLFGSPDESGPDAGEPGDGGPDDGDGTTDPDPDPPSGSLQEQVEELLARAEASFVAADEALAAGDLAGYQRNVDAAANAISEANRLIADAVS